MNPHTQQAAGKGKHPNQTEGKVFLWGWLPEVTHNWMWCWGAWRWGGGWGGVSWRHQQLWKGSAVCTAACSGAGDTSAGPHHDRILPAGSHARLCHVFGAQNTSAPFLELKILLQVLTTVPAVPHASLCHVWAELCTAQGWAGGWECWVLCVPGQQVSSESLCKVLNQQITWFTAAIEREKGRERGWSCYILIREKRCSTGVAFPSLQAS